MDLGTRPSSDYFPVDNDSIYTFVTTNSSLRTESDRPGPGRNLGNLYSYVGLKVEALLSTAAVRIGRGPRQTAKRIRQLTQQDILRKSSRHVELQKAGKRLVKYVRYVDPIELTFYAPCLYLISKVGYRVNTGRGTERNY